MQRHRGVVAELLTTHSRRPTIMCELRQESVVHSCMDSTSCCETPISYSDRASIYEGINLLGVRFWVNGTFCTCLTVNELSVSKFDTLNLFPLQSNSYTGLVHRPFKMSVRLSASIAVARAINSNL